MGYVRVNVTMPTELAELVREQLPGLNVSGVLQDGLRALVRCRHDVALCACCGARAARAELELAALQAFYSEVIAQLAAPIARCATAEGAARVVRDVAESFGVDVARVPLARATKAQRLAAGQRDEAGVPVFVDQQDKPRRRAARRKAA